MSYSPYLRKGQKALVTRASSGSGEASARCFAKAGASIVMNYHSGKKHAEKIVNDIVSDGGEAIAFKANVAQEDIDYANQSFDKLRSK